MHFNNLGIGNGAIWGFQTTLWCHPFSICTHLVSSSRTPRFLILGQIKDSPMRLNSNPKSSFGHPNLYHFTHLPLKVFIFHSTWDPKASQHHTLHHFIHTSLPLTNTSFLLHHFSFSLPLLLSHVSPLFLRKNWWTLVDLCFYYINRLLLLLLFCWGLGTFTFISFRGEKLYAYIYI